MKCPYCHHDELKVTDSRNAQETNAVKRRRECLRCGGRFTTYETPELSIQVQKKDGSFEDFSQQKLVEGMLAACQHTTISRGQVIAVAAKISAELIQRSQRSITSSELGALVMEQLRERDTIAYVRFACVYRRFKEVGELVDLLKSIDDGEETDKKNCKNPSCAGI